MAQLETLLKAANFTCRMHRFISSREPTSPQDRQLNILISNSKKHVDDFVGSGLFKATPKQREMQAATAQLETLLKAANENLASANKEV